MKVNYSKPVLAKGKFWYIKFFYNGKEYRKKEGLNRIKDLTEREEYGNILCASYLLALKQGYNPEKNPEPKPEVMTLVNALDFGMDRKTGKAVKTIRCYRCTINFAKEAISQLGYSNLALSDTKRIHIKAILDKITDNRGSSKKAYNKNLTYLQAVLAESVKKFYIEVNPAHNIEFEKVPKTLAHVPATPEQHKMIMNRLASYPKFRNLVETIYHAGVRPDEALSITIGMIDLLNDVIVLPAAICKDNEDRIIPINKYFKKMLLDMDIFMFPAEFYLFGSFRTSGRGNVGHQQDFIPAPTAIKRDTATKRWHKLIIHPVTGLGLNVTLYSYKKFGANAKRRSGVKLSSIQNMFGHSDEATTRIYLTEEQKEAAIDIIENSPPFL